MLRRMKWNDSFGFYAMFRSVEIDDFRLCSLCVIWVTDVVMSFAFLILMFNCHVLTFSCGRRKKEQSKLLHTLEFFRFSFQKEARSICVCFGISVYIWVVSFNCTTLIAVGILFSAWCDKDRDTVWVVFRFWLGLARSIVSCTFSLFTWTNCCARLNLIIPKTSFAAPDFRKCMYSLCVVHTRKWWSKTSEKEAIDLNVEKSDLSYNLSKASEEHKFWTINFFLAALNAIFSHGRHFKMAPQIRVDTIWYSPELHVRDTQKNGKRTHKSVFVTKSFGGDQGFITNARTFRFSHLLIRMWKWNYFGVIVFWIP